MEPLTVRNAETVESALKDVYARLYEALGVIKLQQAMLSNLAARLNVMEQQQNIQKAQMTGLGPTVRQNGNHN